MKLATTHQWQSDSHQETKRSISRHFSRPTVYSNIDDYSKTPPCESLGAPRLANTGDNQNRFNPLWLEAINQTLLDRGHDHLLASITESLWNRHIEPMIDALEKGAFDGPDVTMRKRKRLGYQVIDADSEMPRGWVSFGIYTLADCRRAIAEDKERWQLVTVFEGDIEEPTFMRSI